MRRTIGTIILMVVLLLAKSGRLLSENERQEVEVFTTAITMHNNHIIIELSDGTEVWCQDIIDGQFTGCQEGN